MARPLWFLSPGGRPVRAKAPPPEAAWWCREGDSAWKPIASDGWKEHSVFFVAAQNDPEKQHCSDETPYDCGPSVTPTNVDTASTSTDLSDGPNQARESRPRVVSLRRPTRRRKHRPAPGQGTLFFVVKNGRG